MGGDVLAPMPGTVVQVLVEVGGRVEPGDRLFIMESMKMELAIDAPRGGVVKGISVAAGSLVDRGMRLLEFEEPTSDG
jgi:3-methylcrotonyl-CoA carboxylase alpha subunit